MENFIQEYEQKKNPVELAAWVHIEFVGVHRWQW